jgi:hypothetical protein
VAAIYLTPTSSPLSAEYQQRDDESEEQTEPERMTSADSLHLADYHEPATIGDFIDSFHDDVDICAYHQNSQNQPEQTSSPPSLNAPLLVMPLKKGGTCCDGFRSLTRFSCLSRITARFYKTLASAQPRMVELSWHTLV